MPSPIGPLTRHYLTRCGYKERRIDSWTAETRLLHDIRLCGDDIWDEFEVMHAECGVDFSDFEFSKYSPEESSYGAFFLKILGRTSIARRIVDKYKPVTFGMIENVLTAKRWIYD